MSFPIEQKSSDKTSDSRPVAASTAKSESTVAYERSASTKAQSRELHNTIGEREAGSGLVIQRRVTIGDRRRSDEQSVDTGTAAEIESVRGGGRSLDTHPQGDDMAANGYAHRL
jgi:hypothetical protein